MFHLPPKFDQCRDGHVVDVPLHGVAGLLNAGLILVVFFLDFCDMFFCDAFFVCIGGHVFHDGVGMVA